LSTEAAESLTRFLTQPDYRGKSPLMQRVEAEIAAMAKTIAQEVVAENPELAEMIRARTREAVGRALRDDPFLNSTVTSAVAKAITQRALDGEEDAHG
jgi:flagellar biosynthesis/type III secretory pathway protein FliH